MRRFVSVSVACAALMAGIISLPGVVGTSLDQHSCEGWVCHGKESPPFDITISIPQNEIAPGAFVTANVIVTATSDISDVDVAVYPDGGVTTSGATQHSAGSMSLGDKLEFEVGLFYDGEVNSGVEVEVNASAPWGESFGRRDGFYTVYRNGRPYHGRTGYVGLEHRAVRDEFEAGLITQEEYDIELAKQLEAEGTYSDTPIPANGGGAFSALPAIQPSYPEGLTPSNPGLSTSTAGTITVQGTVLFTDRNGATHGAFGVQVEVWDDDTIIDDFLDVVVVGSDGTYSFNITNDNSILENGYDIYVKFRTTNALVDVEDGGTYDNETTPTNNTSDGTILTRNFTYANTGDGAAGSVHVGASYIGSYVQYELNGGVGLSQIPINWPAGGAFYDGSSVNIEQGDRFDWDVLHHEYGHYVMDAFNFENNPGGGHSSADCASDERPTKSEGLRLAWGESWPTFFGGSGQRELNLQSLGIPFVGDLRYDDTEESNFGYSLEDESADNLVGEGNERANMRVLWDLWDSTSDGPDNSNYTDLQLFDVFDAGGPTITSSAWADLRGSSLVNTNQLELAVGALCSAHGWGPTLNSPIGGAVVSPSSKTFNWNAAVNCGTYVGDQWDLVFYNPNTYAKILTIPGLGLTSTSISNAQLNTLIAGSANHQVLWAVEGYNTSSPATGPYLGENFQVTVNTPPVADAGDDIMVECDSQVATEVMLDGSGSSDPDGDMITYLWTPEANFPDDQETLEMPTGYFQLGETTVTLTVSDGIQMDSDEVKVTIVDTTDPEVTCPGNITVECSSHCGTPADDEQLEAWFEGFSATDICDPDPDTELTYPDCFPLGTTEVTYEAEDESHNMASCTAYVTVEDTTPPEITVELDRDALWPPNHKMAEVCATVTVTDICDPNPTYVLAEVLSDEEDNGAGDGNTVNDIQGDDLETPDDCIFLRSERSALEDGRKYTIVYTAMDMSGNTADDTSCVVVPHDQGGMGMASLGFDPTGEDFAAEAESFVVVIPTQPGADPTGIDPLWALIGNTVGAVKPTESDLLDVDGDGTNDLVLYYPVEPTIELIGNYAEGTGDLAFAMKPDPVGLHYWDANGMPRLIDDIFMLGFPVELPDPIEEPVDDGGRDPFEDPSGDPFVVGMPEVTGINSIYPNPFNPTTTISFSLVDAARVSIEVYNVNGRLVRTLREERLSAGEHKAVWDARDNAGNAMATGIYFLRFQAGSYETTKKLVLLK